MTLWTPDGEHPVKRSGEGEAPRAGPPRPAGDPLAGLAPEERARAETMVDEMAEVRQQLASVPAEMVVGNHAMGLYELAAIHLGGEPPKLDDARLAIDAMGSLVEGLTGRLGDTEATLVDALSQLRFAFVQVKGRVEASGN